jgi:hypothetical protein
MIFAIYDDDGPNGICGQSMSITCRWHKLYIFDKHEDFKTFEDKVLNSRTSRKRDRISDVFVSDNCSLGEDILYYNNGKFNSIKYMNVLIYSNE